MSSDLEKTWRERLVKNNLDLIVLSLLQPKPKWGYEINLEIRDKFGVYLSAGTLYPLLHSLEEKGYLKGSLEPETGRGRRILQITSSGRSFLSAGARTAQELSSKLKVE